MKKKLVFISVLAIVGMIAISTAQRVDASYAGEIRNAADWEEEVFYPLADLFYNSSGSLSPMAAESEGYTIHRALVGPKGIEVSQHFSKDQSGEWQEFFLSSAQYDDTESEDYTGWNSRDVHAERSFSEYDLLTQGAANYELYNYSALDDTTLPTTSSDELLNPDDETELNGVQYEAGDGKTPIQIGEDIAAYDNYDFTNLINFSIVVFGFNDLDDMTNLMIYFDDAIGTGAGLGIREYQVRRRAVQLFSRIQSGVRNKLTTVKDAFQRVGSNIISGLKELPSKATHILQKTVGSAFHNLKVGVKGFIGNLFKSILAFLTSTTALVVGLGLVAIIIIRKRR